MANKTEGLTPEENLQAETEILKLKLETEYDAVIYTADELKLPAETEFDWFNHIYNYEKLSKEAGYAKIYDFIGKPSYKPLEELEPEEIEKELAILLEKMYSKGIVLNYDDEECTATNIYKFVTEELFNEEVNCYIVSGGHRVFDYETFYPNHKKDLRRYSEEYLEDLLGFNKWSAEFLHYTHEKNIMLNGKEMTLDEYSNRVILFQSLYLKEKPCPWVIENINYNLETSLAFVEGSYTPPDGHCENFVINFNLSYGLWVISGVEMRRLVAHK